MFWTSVKAPNTGWSKWRCPTFWSRSHEVCQVIRSSWRFPMASQTDSNWCSVVLSVINCGHSWSMPGLRRAPCNHSVNSTSTLHCQFLPVYTTKAAITIAIRLRFDSSKWATWQYVNEGMNSYQTTFYFGSRWEGYTKENMYSLWLYQRRQSKDATRRWSVSVNVILITVTYTITSLYAPTAAFWLTTTPFDSAKKWTCLIFVVVESKPNRSRIAIV